jgi:fumarate reductase flavoprotein subunit
MGGILADGNTAAPLAGLYSVGECSSVGIHGANRLGSNSLTELCVFGKTAGVQAAQYARSHADGPAWNAEAAVRDAVAQAEAATTSRGNERIASIRKDMAQAMEDGCGIYRTEATMRAACEKLVELQQRFRRLKLEDNSRAWNTERLTALELGYLLDVAQAMAHSALERRESRGSHQRLDAGYTERDDANFLKHSHATYRAGETPAISYGAVKITRSQPGKRVYGAAGEKADAERHEAKEAVHA